MYIYLDESYNLQRGKGLQFISINGFVVESERSLRKRWNAKRKPFLKYKRRIHATDPTFEALRSQSFVVLKKANVLLISAVQTIKGLPLSFFKKDTSVSFDEVYRELLKALLSSVNLEGCMKIVIVIDARKMQGGALAQQKFTSVVQNFLKHFFPGTTVSFDVKPSYLDTLVELADFVSNSLYKEYMQNIDFDTTALGMPVRQIKNPLHGGS